MDRRSFCQKLASSAILTGCFAEISRAETSRLPGSSTQKIKWQPNLKSAHKLAVKQDKPMLIVFGANWCTFCHKLERETLTDRQTVALIEREFVSVHLDFDKEQRVAKILEAESLPCSVMLSPDADLLARAFGFMEPKEFRAKLSEALEKRAELQQASLATKSTR